MRHTLLRLPEVQKITGKGKTTIYKEIKSGSFPRQILIGSKTVAWLESDIQNWIEEKIRQSANQNEKN